MPTFAIHKILFLHNDDYYEEAPMTEGSVVHTFTSRSEAEKEKLQQDILSLQNLKEKNMMEFIAAQENPKDIFKKLAAYYETEFNIQLKDIHYVELPRKFNNKQAENILEITGLTFHYVIEYADDADFFPELFEFDGDGDLFEF